MPACSGSEELSTHVLEEPRLNFDVLRLVCNYLSDVPDVLSFALTCSALTEDALRRRLRMAPVDLWNADKVDSLHTFIFSNEPSRALCLYGLKITSPSYYGRVIGESRFEIINNRLVAILEAAVRIQYLYFATSICKSVFDTIVKLKTVRELRILNDMYQGTLIVGLTTFRSPLRSLRVTGSGFAGSIIPASFLHDRLSHLAPTLEFLDLDSFPIDIFPSSVTKQYTTVRSLKLQPAFRPDCDVLGVLLRLFPKLDNTLHLGSLNAFITEDDILPFRERNKEAQKQHSWSGLEQLICDADTAYFIGLQCPIRRLDIEVQMLSAARNLTETLRNHSPRHLSVRLSLYNGFGPLDGLFPAEAVDKLMHLVIFVDVEIRHGRRSCRHTRGNVPSDRLMVSEQLLYTGSPAAQISHAIHSRTGFSVRSNISASRISVSPSTTPSIGQCGMLRRCLSPTL